MAVTSFIRRNLISISLPVLTVTVILIDWSHTKNWKLLRKEQE